MATKADFTDGEWEALRRGATGSAMLVSLSDRGFLDTFKEAGALARHMARARESGESELIRELSGERGTGFGLTDRPEEIERETAESLRLAVAALQQKAPGEVESYRRFVLELARSVASAAGGGEEAERQALQRVESALAASA